MVTYKEGILKLNSQTDILDIVWNVCFFMRLLSIVCFGNVPSLYYASFFILLGVSLAEAIVKGQFSKKVFVPLHTIWYGLFIVLGVVSSIWADVFSRSFGPISKMIQILVVSYCLIIHIDSYEKLESYITSSIIASFVLVVYIFALTPSSMWFSGFLGSVTSYNTNDIGCAVSIAVIFSYYKAFIKHKKYMYALCAIFFFVAILTSSRKALFMSVLGIVMITMFNFRAKNYVLRLMVIFALMALVILMIYEIPALYNTVGVRLDSIIEYIMEDKSADSSMAIRQYFIDMAKMFYYENPVFGIGLNNFAYRLSLYDGMVSYAHNNYCEIAADLGTIGLIVYYWFYLYIAIKLVAQIINGHKTALVFSAMMLLFLIFEYGMVNYYKEQVHIVITAAFIAICLNDKAHNEKSNLTELQL